MNRYPEYKDSGVEWIGEVPSHWGIKKIKYVSKLVNGSTPKSDKENWNGEIKWITPSDIGPIKDQMFIVKSERTITTKGLQSCGCSVSPPYSLIVTNRGPIGNVIICKSEFTTNQGCKVLVPKDSYSVEFLYYFLKVSGQTLDSLGLGTTFLELSTNDLSNLKVPNPPNQEQTLISDYLEKKTSLIDFQIEKIQEKIELLKEQKTYLINEVVTKGLNPDVEMKDSGVEWIGDIPSHWERIKIKYLVSTKVTDGPHETPSFVEEGIPFLSVEAVV